MGASDTPGPPAPLDPAQFKTFAELSLDLLLIAAGDGSIVWVNDAAQRILGLDPSEMIGQLFFDSIHPDDVERTHAEFRAILDGKTALDFENRYRHADDSHRWLSWRCGPPGPDGRIYATARDVTDFRRLQESARSGEELTYELARREAQLQAAEESGGFGSWTWNTVTNDVWWSPALYDLLGLPHTDPASFERFFELVHPDDVERVAAHAAVVAEAGELPPQRYRMIRADDGRVREIQATPGTALPAEADGPVIMAGALLDITALVESDRALRRSEAQLREAQRMANVGYFQWDYSTETPIYSEQLYRIWDTKPGEELGSDAFYEHIHEEDRARVRTEVREAMAAEASFEVSFRLLQVGHLTVRHVHMAARPDRAADDVVRGYVGIIQDVTEQQEIADSLLKNEWLLREAQEVAQIGSWTFDPANESATWSDEMYRLCGVEPGARAGMALHLSLVHEADRPALAAAGLERPVNDVAGVGYRLVRRNDGELRHMSTSTKVLRNDEGDPLLVIGTTMDVTDQHRLEEQLRQAQKMEAVGRLAGGVAHDFNNALSAIIGNAELAKMSLPKGTAAGDSLDAVIDAGEQAADVTRQLLAFARRQIVQPAVFDPVDRLTAIQRLMRPMLGEDVAVAVSAEDDGARIRMDPGQFEQLVMNLAVNARDAMPKGGKLTIECHRTTITPANAAARSDGVEAGEYVRIAVTDDGEGMDGATMDRIFEPFFTTKETGLGTGLGLATCHGIVMQNGGYIHVTSALGRGTEFAIHLPHQPDAPPDTAGAVPTLVTGGGSELILLVEDDDRVRAMCATALRRLGYRVTEAGTGAQAVELARTLESIDLLLTDVVLPDMRGPGVAKAVRNIHPDCPVLFASGYPQDSMGEDGVLAEEINFLAKPYTPSQLGPAVRALLDARV